jgi:DNA polymerase-1
VADYSQIQLRIAALLSKDKNMLNAFNNGIDLHKQTAAATLATSATNITKEQRQMGKAISFGLLFGQGAKGLARYAKSAYGVDMSEAEATKARSIYFKTYPDLARWQRLTGKRAEVLMRIETPGGRVRDFKHEKSGYKYTESLNTPIQGAEAEVLMNTLGLLPKRINNFDIKLVNIIHDELVFEIDENISSIASLVIEKVMVDGFLMSFPEARDMTNGLVEASTGPNWCEAK